MDTGATTLAFCPNELAETHGFSYQKHASNEAPAGSKIPCDAGAYRQKAPEKNLGGN
ncbi:MAG: hypothetical protein AAGI90_01525 [Chlamydiota bacterium]